MRGVRESGESESAKCNGMEKDAAFDGFHSKETSGEKKKENPVTASGLRRLQTGEAGRKSLQEYDEMRNPDSAGSRLSGRVSMTLSYGGCYVRVWKSVRGNERAWTVRDEGSTVIYPIAPIRCAHSDSLLSQSFSSVPFSSSGAAANLMTRPRPSKPPTTWPRRIKTTRQKQRRRPGSR